MSDVETVPDKKFDELRDLVKSSFPDISCLRCGHDNVYLLSNVKGPSGLGAVTLACARCGHVEQHLLDVLGPAEKPIPITFDLGLASAHPPTGSVEPVPAEHDNG